MSALPSTETMDQALADTSAFRAPTMGNLQKINYSHADMIDYIISKPGCTQNDLAALVSLFCIGRP